MLDFGDLGQGELLVLGRRASELCARRFEQLGQAADPSDEPLRKLLNKMACDAMSQAADVEGCENQRPEDSRLPSCPDAALRLIRSYLTSLSKSLGEGPLHRDTALFFAESLEEEASRLYRTLSGHSRESWAVQMFSTMADHEKGNFHYLREMVLEG